VYPVFFAPIVKARRWWLCCPMATQSIAAFGYFHNCGRARMGKGSENGRTGVDSCAWWPQTIRESYNLCSSTSLDNHFTRNRKSERRRCRRCWGFFSAMSMTNFCLGRWLLLKFPFLAKLPKSPSQMDQRYMDCIAFLGAWVNPYHQVLLLLAAARK